jgi:hypothetical protein
MVVRDDGLFQFFEDGERYDEYGDGLYWAPSYFSGIYPSAEAAESDARLIIPWLRDHPSN